MHCCYFTGEHEAPTLFPWEKRLLEKILPTSLSKRNNVFKPIDVFEKDKTCAVVLYRFAITGFCPFYDTRRGKCTIHPVKPLSCRIYPIFIDLTKNRLLLSSKCKWVLNNSREITEIAKRGEKGSGSRIVSLIMPREYAAARKVILTYNAVVERLVRDGFKRISDWDKECKEVIDADLVE